MTDHWSIAEVDLIVVDYFSMLTDELNGKHINKTVHRNRLKQHLNNRTDGSVEYKHQNISAVLIKHGLPFIRGYKPMWNFQQILEERTIAYLDTERSQLEFKFTAFANATLIDTPKVNFENMIESAPSIKAPVLQEDSPYTRRPIKINYLEKEQRNLVLGTQGEQVVTEYERWRLSNLGMHSLSEKIEWVSQHDDGAGFDILSKNENGSDRYIEVKTTKLGKETPIFFTKNEYNYSKRHRTSYYLYRLFSFGTTPKMFNVKGSFDEFCRMDAIQFKGEF